MKIKITILLLSLSSALWTAFGQEQKELPKTLVHVSFDKIKHIVFPEQISDIKVGRPDLIEAVRVKEAPFILRLTTQEEEFNDTTNIVVVCQNGDVHAFRICYFPDSDNNIIYASGQKRRSHYNVFINSKNSVQLFFPEDVIYCWQGNEENLNVKYYNNQISSSTLFDDIPETNLFVVDRNNDVYEITFQKGFADSYTYNLVSDRKYIAHVDVNSAEMRVLISNLKIKRRNIHSLGVIKNKFEISVSNLYVKDEFLFFSFDIRNYSNIDYDVDFIKCFIKDKQTNKKAIQQEVPVLPVYRTDFEKMIKRKSKNRFVLVFNKFTIPDDKIFEISVFEKGGGRHMNIEILNEYILSAQFLKL